jgi:hypothetical protein
MNAAAPSSKVNRPEPAAAERLKKLKIIINRRRLTHRLTPLVTAKQNAWSRTS